MMKKYLYVIASLLLFSGIAYAYYGGSSGVMTDTNCNQAQYFNIGVLCQDADDGKLYKGTGSAIEQIQAYDADLDTWAGITPSTDVQTMLGSANATAIRSNIGLGTIATQAADSVNIDGGAIDGTAIGANSASTGAFTTLSATGQIKGVPSATAPIMFGNTTPVNTSTGATFPTATKTQISKAGAFTNAAVGDLIIVTGGTGATTGQYRLTTKTSNDLVVVDRNIHASGTDITDGEFTVYKDVVTVSPTDGTNGQMISGWSHNYRPLQIGGSTLAATSHQLSSKDVIFGGSVEFESNAYFDASLSTINGLYFYYLNTGNNIGCIQGYPVDDGLKIALNTEDGKGNNNLIITTFANGAKDHDHETASANPTLFIHSNTNPDSDNTQWISFNHDQTDGVITTGTGIVKIKEDFANSSTTSSGGFARRIAEATSGTLSGATGTIAVNVPSGARILGVQLRVDTAVTFSGTDTTWQADYVNTPTTTICSGQALAKSTKYVAIHPAYEITTGTVTITLASDGSDTFTGGVIRGIVYYEDMIAMGDAE
jgi:hypothetical protein